MSNFIRKFDTKIAFGIALSFTGICLTVLASSTPNFTLEINPGTLSIDIVDPADLSSMTNPSFGIGGASIFSSMESATATGILGDVTNGVIYISNPSATNAWTASVAANTTQWTTGGTTPTVFPYNAATQAQGQLTINPSVASLSAGDRSGIILDASVSLGNSGTFSDTVSSITLAQASVSAPRIADFVIQNIDVSQVIPARTPAGDYSLGITLSIIGEGGAPVSAPLLLSQFEAYHEHYDAADIAVNDFSKPLINTSFDTVNNAVVDGSDDALDSTKTFTAGYDENTANINVSSFAINYMFFKFSSNDPTANISLYTQNPLVYTSQAPVGIGVGSITIPNYCVYNYPVFGTPVYTNCNAGYSTSAQTKSILYILLENSNGTNMYILNSQQG